MVLLKNLSIRWKLSLALILTGLSLVLSYVFIAKRVFESDKISYVFDSEGSSVQSIKQEFMARFEHSLQSIQFIMDTYDVSTGKPSATGMNIFTNEKALIALELYDPGRRAVIFRLEKKPGLLDNDLNIDNVPKSIRLVPLSDDNAFIGFKASSKGAPIFVRAVLNFQQILPVEDLRKSIAFMQDGKIVYKVDYRGISDTTFKAISAKLQSAKEDTTTFYRSARAQYLVSEAAVNVGDLRIFELTPEKEALGALGTLFNRSLVFLVFSFFGLVAVSVLVSRSLTWRLANLTNAAEQIGQGNFEILGSENSADEVGILARAFRKMSQEIRRLLAETREKARMEEELKTAKLVQERLLPEKSSDSINKIDISGAVVTSSECGGDWWYYFTKGDDLYVAVADATGHGTPAALITAAARSVFSRLETETLTLVEMAIAWDNAVASCSGREVLMTGLLLKIDTQTGEGTVINCSHELPLLFRPGTSSYDFSALDIPKNGRLGDGLRDYIQQGRFRLEPGDFLFAYTDGLYAVQNKKGQLLSERRLARSMSAKLNQTSTSASAMSAALDQFNEFREGGPVPDDVSIVVLHRK